MSANSDNIDQPGLPSEVFPHRNPEEGTNLQKSGFMGWYQNMITTPGHVARCENLARHTMKHPALKLLVRAMESSGCKFNFDRHIICEPCATNSALGAYDPKHNQVVVCAGVCLTDDQMYTNLGYNMMQMFDACRAHVDFRNIDHLACAEIRSSNLFVCGTYGAGRKYGGANLLGYEGTQSECVKRQATMSVQQMMKVDEPTARAAVNRVFARCYGDLEPFGQRVENANVAEILYERRRNYGYY